MSNCDSQKQVPDENSSEALGGSVGKGTWFARVAPCAFVLCLMIGSRMLLGNVTRARGRIDIATSVAMMLLVIFIIEWLAPRLIREILLLVTGAAFILFHLVYGAYYRFYHTSLPFDVFRQWRDLFVVGGYGAGLISTFELVIAVALPIFLLLWIVRRPSRGNPILSIILIVVIVVGWTNRLNRPLNRPVSALAALPDFLHKTGRFQFRLRLKKGSYQRIIRDLETIVPRHLLGYRPVKDKGIMVEPIEPSPKGEPLKYNIILILMESVRAYECGFLGADPSFTPGLDALAAKAKIYTSFYANGSQTVRGEIGILCSIYPNPIGAPTYIARPDLRLISLPEILCGLGYDTLWFSGYTADFHNKRAFLSRHGIKKIFDKDVFPKPAQPEIGWGMNDCEMFGHVWNVLKDCNEPFFAQVTTLSNHCAEAKYPTQADTPIIKGSDIYHRYMDGTYYTDYAVSEFIKKVQNSQLAKNTIILATGDHGLWQFPDGTTDPLQRLEIYFRLPLCIWGPPELIKPGRDDTLGSHIDVAPTLMDMLNIRSKNTFLGQSLLNKDIPHEERYVASFLGSVPCLRVGNVFALSKPVRQRKTQGMGNYVEVEHMSFYSKMALDLMTVEGDLLRGRHTSIPFDDPAMEKAISKRLDDITLLTAYGVYFDAFQGTQ